MGCSENWLPKVPIFCTPFWSITPLCKIELEWVKIDCRCMLFNYLSLNLTLHHSHCSFHFGFSSIRCSQYNHVWSYPFDKVLWIGPPLWLIISNYPTCQQSFLPICYISFQIYHLSMLPFPTNNLLFQIYHLSNASFSHQWLIISNIPSIWP